MPRIETTPVVKLSLYLLRGYLIFLLILILMKFVRVHAVHTRANHAAPPTTTSTVVP